MREMSTSSTKPAPKAARNPPISGPSSKAGNSEAAVTPSSSAAIPASNGVPLEASSLNVDLLPIFHDIVRVIEKDNQDVSQKNKDSLEASQKVQELHKKIEQIREQIYKLPGIERAKSEQLHQLEILRSQLEAKKRLIAKYKELNLKVSGLSGGYSRMDEDHAKDVGGGDGGSGGGSAEHSVGL